MAQDQGFDAYVVTSVNPGYQLLLCTLAFCISCVFLMYFITLRNRSSLREILFRHISSLNENIYLGEEESEDESSSGKEEFSMSRVERAMVEEELEVEGESVKVTTVGKTCSFTNGQAKESNSPFSEENHLEAKHAENESMEIELEEENINIITVLGRQRKKKYCLAKRQDTTHHQEDALVMDDFSPITLLQNAYPPIEEVDIEEKKIHLRGNETLDINPTTQQMMSEGLVIGEGKKKKRRWWKKKEKSERTETEGKGKKKKTKGLSVRKEPKGFSVRKETKKIIGLMAPWSFTSFVSSGSALIIIVAISQTIGIAEMIAYTYVWYIISILFVINRALYSSIFHHVNISVSLETEEGNFLTGKYLQMSVFLNLAFATPVSIASVFLISPILTNIGYGEAVVRSCQTYAALASVSNVLETSLSMVSCVLDITGHAKFNAVFDFWETMATVFTVIFVMPFFEPSLISLGLIFLVQDLVMISIFMFITVSWKGWFKEYYEGLFAPFYYSWNDSALLSVIKYTVPFIWSEVIGEFEWTVLAFFASYQGEAEAATWILLYYLWDVPTIIPENYGSAAAVRAAYHIAKGNVPAAKSVILRSFKIVVAITCVSMILLFIFRQPLVSLLTNDETLSQMLVEIVPYICLCEPFLAIGTVASNLNEGIGLYDKSTGVYFWVTMLVTLPSAWVFTYYFQYNIEGLASALCFGSIVYGVINVDIFMNKKISVESTVNEPKGETDVIA